MKKTGIVFLLFFCMQAQAQKSNELNLLVNKSNADLAHQKKELKDNRGFTFSYNPFKLVGNSLIWVYQKVFSEQINADCGFSPSCSSYAKEALKQRGFFIGVLLSADRLTRCNGAAQIESEVYLVDKKTGKLQDDPGMYKLSK